MNQKKSKNILAVDCGGTFIKTALIDERGSITDKDSIETNKKGKEEFIQSFEKIIKKYYKKIEAVGIAFAGPLNAKEGIIEEPPNFPKFCYDLPLVKILQERCNLPVYMENDANLAALGEYWQGLTEKARVLIVITLGTGVGGGIIINGKIWNGASGIAGEIGHIPIYPGGYKCGCGNIGCLETFASSTAVVRMYKSKEKAAKKITAEKIYELATEGNKEAQEVFTKVGETLGKGIVILCHILGPDQIVITGGGAGAWNFFQKPMYDTINTMCFEKEKQVLKISCSKLEGNSGILGAAFLAWQNLGKM